MGSVLLYIFFGDDRPVHYASDVKVLKVKVLRDVTELTETLMPLFRVYLPTV